MIKKKLYGFALVIVLVISSLLPCLQVDAASNKERIIYEYLINSGFNTAAACGILANIEAESSFDPNLKGDYKNGVPTSYGICQWHDTRWTSLKNYRPNDWNTLDGQLAYMIHELETEPLYKPLNRKLRNNISNTSAGAYEAGRLWCVDFESPANEVAVSKDRAAQAKNNYWPRYGGAPEASLEILASDEGGYMVQCVVNNSDMTGELMLASWAETRGTENVKWTPMVEVSKNVFKLYVPFSDHANIEDRYYNDVYMNYGQESMQCLGRVSFDHRVPTAESLEIVGSDENGYMVQCVVNDNALTGALTLASWAQDRDTGTAVWTEMVEVEKNVFKLFVPFSDHGNVRDIYYNDVYIHYGTDNMKFLGRVSFEHRLPAAESVTVTDSDEGGYMVQCIVNNSDLTGELMLASWAESRDTATAVWTKMVETEKNVFKLYVPFSDHENVRDIYYNDVYMNYGTDDQQFLGRVSFDHKLVVPYKDPDFTLPRGIKTIKEYAFENTAMTVAYIPDGCRTISAYAFKDCRQLTQIRIPNGCSIADTAFDGCNLIYIFGTAGSPAETFCSSHDKCVFMEE